MRKPIRTIKTALALALAITFTGVEGFAWQDQQQGGAGGQYKGPGDTVPQGRPEPTAGPTSPAPRPYAGPGDVAPNTPTIGGAGETAPFGGGNPGGVPEDPDAPTQPDTPEARPFVQNPQSWQLWWHYNRWDHLELGGVSGLLASSGYGGFFLGRDEQVQRPSLAKATDNQIANVVLPALTDALAKGGSVAFEIQALHAYAKLRGQDSSQPGRDFSTFVRSALKSGNQELSEKAILALGVRGERRYATWLLALLEEKPLARDLMGTTSLGARGRAFTLYALGLLCEQLDDPGLRQAIYSRVAAHLGASRPEVQAAAVMTAGLVPLPVEGSASSDGRATSLTRIDQILDVLAFFESEDVSPIARSQAPAALARLLEDAPESARTLVAHALLVAIGTHSREASEVQRGAAIALGRIGNSSDTPIDQEIRKELERVAYGSSQDRLTRYLSMVSFAEAASRPGPGEEPFYGLKGARRVLLRQLSRNRGESLCWTALALGILEEDAAERGDAASHNVADGLRHAFKKNRSAEVAGALAVALGLLRDVEAGELLLERMQTAGEVHVRGYSALALGMIGASNASEPLHELLGQSLGQPFALSQAALALFLIGDAETGPRLLELSEEAASPKARASIAAALGWSKDPRVLEPLCERFTRPGISDATKAWTCVAIGRICDQDDWPWVGRLSIGVQYDVELPTLIQPETQTGLLDMP